MTLGPEVFFFFHSLVGALAGTWPQRLSFQKEENNSCSSYFVGETWLNRGASCHLRSPTNVLGHCY